MVGEPPPVWSLSASAKGSRPHPGGGPPASGPRRLLLHKKHTGFVDHDEECGPGKVSVTGVLFRCLEARSQLASLTAGDVLE